MGFFELIWKLAKYATILIVVAFGSLIFAVIFTQPLRLNSTIPDSIKNVIIFLTGGAFGLGLLVIILKGEYKVIKYSAPIGAIIPSAFLVISWITLIPSAISNTPLPITIAPDVLFWIITGISLIGVWVFDILTGKVTGSKPWRPKRRTNSSIQLSVKTTPTKMSSSLIGAFEIIEYPSDYTKDDETQELWKIHEPFRNIVRGLATNKTPVGLRIEKHEGRMRHYFLTFGRSSSERINRMNLLKSLLSANLPRFRFKQHLYYEGIGLQESNAGTTVTITGELLDPENQTQRPDPLTPLMKHLQLVNNTIVQIFAIPVSGGITRSIQSMLKTRQYQSKFSQARITQSSKESGLFGRGTEQSVTHVDVGSTDEASRISRDLKRVKAKFACNVSAVSATWGYDAKYTAAQAKNTMDILKSTLTPADPEKDFKIRTNNDKKKLQQVMWGEPVGNETLMTIEETATLFVLPRYPGGIKTTKRSTFTSGGENLPEEKKPRVKDKQVESPVTLVGEWKSQRTDIIILGNPMLENGSVIPNELVWFKIHELDAHIGIYGNTRFGKTTTALSIVAQANKCGVIPTVLVPFKSKDWRPLIYLDNGFWYFTAGNSEISPLYYNFWTPPPGVRLNKWVERLGQIFSAWMPNDEVMTMHFNKIFHQLYADCGWDIKNNKHGRPIMMEDFIGAALTVCNRLRYGDELKQNFTGALYSRLDLMLRNHTLVQMCNTTKGITIPDLLSYPTIIDMDYLGEEDKILLSGILSAAISEYRMANPSSKLNNLLVFEEAHNLLSNPRTGTNYGATPQEEAVRGIVTMLRTAGGTGLGVMFLDHLPTKLVEEVLKLPVNTIIHTLKDDDEYNKVGRYARCDESQREHIGGMAKGETVVYLASKGMPVNVKIVQLGNLLKSPLPKDGISDSAVRLRMKHLLADNSHILHYEPITDDLANQLDEKIFLPTDRVSVPPTKEVRPETKLSQDAIVASIAKVAQYIALSREHMKSAKEGNLEPMVSLEVDMYREFEQDGIADLEFASKIHVHTMKEIGILFDSKVSQAVFTMVKSELGF